MQTEKAAKLVFEEEHSVYRILFHGPEEGHRLPEEIAKCVAPGAFMLNPGYSIERFFDFNEEDEECVVVSEGPLGGPSIRRIFIPRKLLKKYVHEEVSYGSV